jgi:hypothetical protein
MVERSYVMLVSVRGKFLPDLTGSGKNWAVARHKPGMTTNHLAPCGPCCADGPPLDVTNWRRCRLLESGFAVDLADRLASMPAIDIHALLQLVDRGCPPELAARILSPVASSGGPA